MTIVIFILFACCFVMAQTLALPADTESKLVGNLSGAFPVVIGVVVAIAGVGLIIKLIKKAGWTADDHAGLHEFRPDLQWYKDPVVTENAEYEVLPDYKRLR
jgi:hypothetical protein